MNSQEKSSEIKNEEISEEDHGNNYAVTFLHRKRRDQKTRKEKKEK